MATFRTPNSGNSAFAPFIPSDTFERKLKDYGTMTETMTNASFQLRSVYDDHHQVIHIGPGGGAGVDGIAQLQ